MLYEIVCFIVSALWALTSFQQPTPNPQTWMCFPLCLKETFILFFFLTFVCTHSRSPVWVCMLMNIHREARGGCQPSYSVSLHHTQQYIKNLRMRSSWIRWSMPVTPAYGKGKGRARSSRPPSTTQ